MKIFWSAIIVGGLLLWIGNAMNHLAMMF